MLFALQISLNMYHTCEMHREPNTKLMLLYHCTCLSINCPISTHTHYTHTHTHLQEAAIFAQEGIDNDKFASHPNGVYSKIAFTIAHNPFFYITEFVVCCLLLGLAVIEYPALVKIHATDERISVVVSGQ